jgi:AraC family transcriptional regulator
MLLLGHGEFLGREITRISVPGFIVTFRQSGSARRDDTPHCHSTPHLLLPLDTGYWSEADGFDARNPAQLIYTPADTCHRDSMVRFRGRYLSISMDDRIARQSVESVRHPIALGRPIATRIAHCIAWRAIRGDSTEPFLEEACLIAVGELARSPRLIGAARPRWLRHLLEICHSYVDTFPTISDMAAMIGVHPVHVTRVFRSCFGIPLSEYIRSVKVQRAAALLRTGKTSVAMAAIDNGFSDQSHLCKSFKAVMGITPSAYQALFRVYPS